MKMAYRRFLTQIILLCYPAVCEISDFNVFFTISPLIVEVSFSNNNYVIEITENMRLFLKIHLVHRVGQESKVQAH